MITLRETQKDRENLEVIKEYLELHRPELPYAKTAEAVRYALSIAAMQILQELEREQEADRKEHKTMSHDWDRYMGRDVTPEEYAEAGGNLRERVRADLTDLWGNHPTDRLTPDEIDKIADDIGRQLE